MVTLFMLPFLIPNATQTEKLLDDDATGCDGSYYRRYFGKDRGDGFEMIPGSNSSGNQQQVSTAGRTGTPINDASPTGQVRERTALPNTTADVHLGENTTLLT